MNFNLLTEPWIPVLYQDGRCDRLGIQRTLADAHKIRQIAASNPMDRLAVLRFLLALLYWCRANPPIDHTEYLNDPLPGNWFARLDDHGDHFNLLGPGKRFYQYQGLNPAKDKILTANYLIQEVPTGINFWHFRHSTDSVAGLCRACCALGLLRLPVFATSGGRGKPPGINSKPPIYALPMGSTLASTLRLSWQQTGELGTPAWMSPQLSLPDTGDVPLLVGMTWIPRRVWLDSPAEEESVCISCGRSQPLIRHCVFAPIGSTKQDEDSPKRTWHDPHVIYESNEKSGAMSLHAADSLGAADAASGQWVKVTGGVFQGCIDVQTRSSVREAPDSCCPKIWLVGFASVQNDKYLEAWEAILPYHSSVSELTQGIELGKRWLTVGSGFTKKVLPKVGVPSRQKHREITSLIAAIRPEIESRVSSRLFDFMTGSDEAWQRAADEYRPMMDAVAVSLSPGFTSSAVQLRQHIAGVKPEFSQAPQKKPRTKPTKKGKEQ